MRMETFNLIEIKKGTLEQTCSACPTIFEWEDKNNRKYYFRLRWGGWTIVDETEKAIMIASGSTDDGFDGCCDWEDAKKYALEQQLIIKD